MSRVSRFFIEIDCFLICSLQITMPQLYIGLNWRAPSLLSAHVFPPSGHFLKDIPPEASSVSSGTENSYVLIEARNLWVPVRCSKIHLIANTIRHFLVLTKTQTTRSLKAALRTCVWNRYEVPRVMESWCKRNLASNARPRRFLEKQNAFKRKPRFLGPWAFS